MPPSDLAETDKAAPDVTGSSGDIVVTARRRSESLQSVPVTMSAFGDTQFRRLQVADLTDLSGKSPNVQVSRTGAGTGAVQVFIRGIGQDALAFNVENPVGLYLDDVYLGRPQGAMLDLLDFDRIEILRGPQGTLYGRNSTVGAVKYVTKEPDLNTMHVRASATVGSFGRADGQVAGSIPLIDGVLAAKLDVGFRNEDGYIDIVDATGRKTGKHGNAADRQNARLVLLYQPDAALSIDLTADYGRDRSGSTQPTPIGCASASGPCAPVFGSPYNGGENGARTGRNDSGGLSARIAYRLPSVTLKSISSYRATRNLDFVDLDGVPPPLPGSGLTLPDRKRQHQFSQEFQAATSGTGPFSVVAGVFYFNENIHHLADYLGVDQNDDRQNSNSVAGYVEASYKLTDRFSVTAGGRYSYDHKSIDRRITTGPTLLYSGADDFSTTKFTYKLGADYTLSDTVLTYATYSTGYRPGGYVWTYPTQDQVRAGVVLATTKTESSRNLEAGAKMQFFDRHLRLNVAGFLTKYSDLQAQDTSFPFPVLSKDVKIKGVEADFDASLFSGFSVFGSIGYLHSRIAAGIGEGQSPRFTPSLQFSAGGEYRHPVSEAVEAFVGANMTHTGTYRTDDSFIAAVVQKPYTLVGAQAGLELEGGRYRASIEGKNLTDKAYFVASVPGLARWYAQPRSILGTVAVRF